MNTARLLLCFALVLPARTTLAKFTDGVRVAPETRVLQPGEFVWEPERSPKGPVLLVVSKPEQLAYVYRNGVRIARSTVSTGKAGHGTPTGVFTVLGKEKMHHSNLYNSAPMPFMERLTWDGIALHAGELPGYPASHGCVRLPLKFSELLYGVTQKGITVIIADDHSAPRETVHPGLVFEAPARPAPAPAKPPARTPAKAPAKSAAPPAEPPLLPPPRPGPPPAPGTTWSPERAPEGPVTILFSGQSRTLVIYRNGEEIGRSPFELNLAPGQHVYSALDGADEKGRRKWIRVDGRPAEHDPSFSDISVAGQVPAPFLAVVRGVITPGTTMVVTDLPVDESTQSEPGFKVLALMEDLPPPGR